MRKQARPLLVVATLFAACGPPGTASAFLGREDAGWHDGGAEDAGARDGGNLDGGRPTPGLVANGVQFDVLAESCYVAYQGQPSGWASTFSSLAASYPTIQLAIAEYSNEAVTSPAATTSMWAAKEAGSTPPGLSTSRPPYAP